MLTNSRNIQIRHASVQLTLAKSARATLILLCGTCALLQARQNGQPFGSAGYSSAGSSSAASTNRPSPHTNSGAPSARPTSSTHMAPAPANVPSISNRTAPTPVNRGTNRPSASYTPSVMNSPNLPAKAPVPTAGAGWQGLRPSGSSTTATYTHNGTMNPNPTPTNSYAGAPGPDSHTRYVNRYTPNAPTITHVTNNNTYINRRDEGRPEHSIGRHEPFIPNHHFSSHFGREHEFHINRQVLMAGGNRRFQFGGVLFGMAQPWPSAWRETDAVYVDYVGSSYMLCNRAYPGVRIPVNVEECVACAQTAAVAPACDSCTPAPLVTASPADATACTDCALSGNSDGLGTLTRGQTIAEVVAILGTPARAVDLGIKQIYLYQNMKVTFIGGRMSDVI